MIFGAMGSHFKSKNKLKSKISELFSIPNATVMSFRKRGRKKMENEMKEELTLCSNERGIYVNNSLKLTI